MQPRLIRLRDVSDYLGMDINRFNKEVRPDLIVIPIGMQGIAFDRLDLDNWVDQYKRRNGCPASNRRGEIWDEKNRQGFTNVEATGISTNKLSEAEFARALDRIRSKRLKNI